MSTSSSIVSDSDLSVMEGGASISAESTPLLGVTKQEVKSSSSSHTSIFVISLTILLGLTAVFGVSAYSTSFGSYKVTSLAADASSSPPCDISAGGVSFCPGELPGNIANVHLKPGCVMMSVNDLTTLPKNPDYKASPILTMCASMASGVVMVDHDMLQKYNMVDGDKSYISSILFADDIQMKMFSGNNFDGAVMGSNGTPFKDPYTKVIGLTSQKFTSTPNAGVNDNVHSFLFATSSVEMNSCLKSMEFRD